MKVGNPRTSGSWWGLGQSPNVPSPLSSLIVQLVALLLLALLDVGHQQRQQGKT